MPDRATIPLITGVTLGFIVGLIAAVQQLELGTVLVLSAVVAVVSLVAGITSVTGVEGARGGDKPTVGLLRGGLAAATGVLIILGMRSLLAEGSPLGLLLLLVAGVVALPLARMRVRTREG